eukprot:5884578-Prymnesium_polylepis.2
MRQSVHTRAFGIWGRCLYCFGGTGRPRREGGGRGAAGPGVQHSTGHETQLNRTHMRTSTRENLSRPRAVPLQCGSVEVR